MSGTYTSNSSLLNDTLWVVLLSQRDLSSQVPINYVTQPTVSLTAACFDKKVYDAASGSLCFSNLLTVGYRRFIIDLYWSRQNQQWLLCPVAIPPSSGAATSLYDSGPYSCSRSFNATTLTGVLRQYFQTTGQALDTRFLYVIFNIHAAADSDSPDEAAPSLSAADLPPNPLYLGPVFNDALSSYIYSPPQLRQERSNLNISWYHDMSGQARPLANYFNTTTNANGVQSTSEGWPCEVYLDQKLEKRLLLGWGSVDPQVQGYNFSLDNQFIFSAEEITSNVSTTLTADGSGLQSGCFYDPQASSVPHSNTSWAYSSVNTNLTTTFNTSLLFQNLTGCGISPLLDQTLSGKTADSDVDPYRNLSVSSLWSWSIGEPQNVSVISNDQGSGDTTELFRCAFMDLTLTGHWRAGNCSDRYRAACRAYNFPYSWVISDKAQSFSEATDACPSNMTFDVPRTGLENTYLYQSTLSALNGGREQRVWVNFNSLDVQYCWVLGGPNVTCPYTPDGDDIARRTILIPTIAAIIILIVTALTVFVKCNSNRHTSRRRKRVVEGWDYEGVPS